MCFSQPKPYQIGGYSFKLCEKYYTLSATITGFQFSTSYFSNSLLIKNNHIRKKYALIYKNENNIPGLNARFLFVKGEVSSKAT